jgi:hypothetical protein
MNIQSVMSILQLILACGNLCMMAYALSTFLNRPHDTLEKRVTNLEVRMDEAEDSLKQGNDRFREINATFEIIITSLLALIEFEIQYCYTENKPVSVGLEKAKNNLNGFLARRNHVAED